jgi:hypothetical protein
LFKYTVQTLINVRVYYTKHLFGVVMLCNCFTHTEVRMFWFHRLRVNVSIHQTPHYERIKYIVKCKSYCKRANVKVCRHHIPDWAAHLNLLNVREMNATWNRKLNEVITTVLASKLNATFRTQFLCVHICVRQSTHRLDHLSWQFACPRLCENVRNCVFVV